MVHPTTPQHGDVCVFKAEDSFFYASGFFTVNGDERTVFPYCVKDASVFRPSDGSYTSCSGGPCPRIDKYEWKLVSALHPNRAWNWGPNQPGAGMGVEYNYTTRLWECIGDKELP